MLYTLFYLYLNCCKYLFSKDSVKGRHKNVSLINLNLLIFIREAKTYCSVYIVNEFLRADFKAFCSISNAVISKPASSETIYAISPEYTFSLGILEQQLINLCILPYLHLESLQTNIIGKPCTEGIKFKN